MILENQIIVDDHQYTVVISDEKEALLAAYAAGRAIVGVINKNIINQSLSPAEYVVETIDDLTEEFLIRVVKRRYHMPWIIAETDKIILREFKKEDASFVPIEECLEEADKIFFDQELLGSYIDHQYRFYEYGIWAVVEKKTGKLIGKAGITDFEEDVNTDGKRHMEIGYHIFKPYRNRGFATECIRAILQQIQNYTEEGVYARIKKENQISRRIVERLGFKIIAETGHQQEQCICLYVWNSR